MNDVTPSQMTFTVTERVTMGQPAHEAVREQAAVFARKWNALRDTLIDDVDRHLREAIHVGFTRAEIAAFDRVVEETIDAIVIVLIIFGRVNSPLRSDTMRSAWGILETEAFDFITKFAHRRGG